MLPDIAGNKELVDRIAVLVSGGEMEQLLAVPKIGRGTGQEQCNACLRALDDWHLKPFVQGLVFDTTASNTGLKMGACTLLENAMDKELVWISCRHHVFEVMLSSVFSAALGTTSGPEIGLFKRFQKMWPNIDKTNFQSAGDDLFIGMPDGLRQDMTAFYIKAIKRKSPRDDYRELLQLCHVFLDGTSLGETCFRAPGAMHNARWMAKAIYSLKMYLFRGQIKLTTSESAGLTSISLFVSLVYARYWHEAPLAERAPFNDYNLLVLLHDYPAPDIRQAAIDAFCRHLWFFSEHLVTLALFDDRVSDETNAAMVENFARSPNHTAAKRLDKKAFNIRTPLEAYVTSRSLTLFNLLSLNGKEESQAFLTKPPALWPTDPTYLRMKAKVRLMKAVNDCAERVISLIQSYNSALTKDETRKQYLLQLVSNHRKQFPAATKTAL